MKLDAVEAKRPKFKDAAELIPSPREFEIEVIYEARRPIAGVKRWRYMGQRRPEANQYGSRYFVAAGRNDLQYVMPEEMAQHYFSDAVSSTKDYEIGERYKWEGRECLCVDFRRGKLEGVDQWLFYFGFDTFRTGTTGNPFEPYLLNLRVNAEIFEVVKGERSWAHDEAPKLIMTPEQMQRINHGIGI